MSCLCVKETGAQGREVLASALTRLNRWRSLESPSQVLWGSSDTLIIAMETIEISDIKEKAIYGHHP